MTEPVLIERRQDSNSQAMVLLIHELTAAVSDLRREVKDAKATFTYHHATYVEATEKAITKAMTAAFPDGDPEGHRRHHEAVIRAAEEKAEFWSTMRKEVGKWGLISVIGFLALAAWNAFLQGPHK